MLSAMKFIVSYSSIRVILYVVFTISFTVFFAGVLMKRRIVFRVLGVALLLAFIVSTAFLPAENLFVRFSTPVSAMQYALPNEQVLNSVEHGNWAIITFEDKRTALVRRDGGGWMTIVPGSDQGFGKGAINNISWQTRRLDEGVYYVGVNYKRYANPESNTNRILIDTITDSAGNAFETYQKEILKDNGELYCNDIYHWTFADASAPGYHLVINGQGMSME